MILSRDHTIENYNDTVYYKNPLFIIRIRVLH